MSYLLVLVTCPDENQAKDLAAALVAEKLAACVQLSKVDSYYTWQGETCVDPEIRLSIKTAKKRYDRLEKFITSRHSYEVPQIVAIDISTGLPAYLDWIDETTSNG